MDATRRNFLRGMLISLGLSMVPVAAIAKRKPDASCWITKLDADLRAATHGDGILIVGIDAHDQIVSEIITVGKPAEFTIGYRKKR